MNDKPNPYDMSNPQRQAELAKAMKPLLDVLTEAADKYEKAGNPGDGDPHRFMPEELQDARYLEAAAKGEATPLQQQFLLMLMMEGVSIVRKLPKELVVSLSNPNIEARFQQVTGPKHDHDIPGLAELLTPKQGRREDN